MVFIVKKKIHGKDYFYLRESKRVNGKVKSIDLGYLGKTRKEAEDKLRRRLKKQNKEKTEVKKEIKLGNKLDEINKIASTKGFFFQTAGLYGGASGFYTYGHLGKALKSNWEKLWRENIISLSENFYEIQSNNILPEEVFKASGHIENFNDPMSECKKCHFRFRADQFLEDHGMQNTEALTIEQINKEIKERNLKCPKCGGEVSEAKQFNMMFSVDVGFDNEKSYLSPETAQGAYITFLEEFKATRGKLPLGLAIIDKAYRNEISPRQMFFRLREFSQAELQIFFDPEKIDEHEKWNEVRNKKLRIKLSKKEETEEMTCTEANEKLKLPKFYLYHASKVQEFYLNILGIPKEKFRFRELSKEEKAFYNKIHFDVEVDLDTLGGFKEVAGIHYRTNHDLAGHAKISGKNLEVSYEDKKILPHILELSFGVDRNVWTLLDIFYGIGKEGSMFKFPAKLAPVKAAIFPIVKRKDMEKIAENIFQDLKEDFNVVYDKSGSIGRRYARNDEIGTPFCITIDDESLRRKDVTVRWRDTGEQVRIKIKNLRESLRKAVNGKENILKLGKLINTRKK